MRTATFTVNTFSDRHHETSRVEWASTIIEQVAWLILHLGESPRIEGLLTLLRPVQLMRVKSSVLLVSVDKTCRLSPFQKLPSIGHTDEYTPHPPDARRDSSGYRRPHPLVETEKNNNNVPQPVSISIAVRLSDGRRLQKDFSASDRLDQVIEYIRSEHSSLPEQIFLSTGDVPKRQFHDSTLTLEQANIRSRTVLFIDRFE